MKSSYRLSRDLMQEKGWVDWAKAVCTHEKTED